MTTITHATLIRLAAENFAVVTALAASSRPGCRIARQELAAAAKHGLDRAAYIVRDGRCYGWGAGAWAGRRAGMVPRIEPLFGVGA